MTHYVQGFCFFGNKVVLVQKSKPEWQRGKLNGVGGKVEDGEGIFQAMEREFREETRWPIPSIKWNHFASMEFTESGNNHYVVHCFYANMDIQSTVVGLPDEPVGWYRCDQLPFNTINNLRWLIPLARDERMHFPVLLKGSF